MNNTSRDLDRKIDPPATTTLSAPIRTVSSVNGFLPRKSVSACARLDARGLIIGTDDSSLDVLPFGGAEMSTAPVQSCCTSGPLLINGLLTSNVLVLTLSTMPSTDRGADGMQRLPPSDEQILAANREP